jgi:choline monooxygenase
MRTDLQTQIARFDPTLPIASALTPPASWYTDPGFLRLEKEGVFKTQWQFVGTMASLNRPGDYFSGVFMGWPFVVCLDEDGALQAYYNICSHHGTCVAKGSGNTQSLVCPYHGWTYGLSGKLLRAPRAGKLEALKTRNLDLKPIPVSTWGPLVALHFGMPELPLSQQVAPLAKALSRDPFSAMRFVRRESYEIPCNWKVYVDNYLDGGYHVPHMHPGLSQQLDIASYRNTLGDHWSIQACAGSTESDKSPTHTADFRERLGDQADYAWLYPNFMLNRYGPWLDTNWIIPLGVDRCMTVFDYFYEGEPSEEAVERALLASRKVQDEDIAICDMVQTGLQSGIYQQGVYAPKFEIPMIHFHRMLAKDLSKEASKF